MSKASSRYALVVGALLWTASASEASPWQHQGSAGALDSATLPKLRNVRAQRTSEEGHTTKAGGSPAASASADAELPGIWREQEQAHVSVPAGDHLSALATSAGAAADDLVGKEEAQSILEPIAANQSPLKLSGDITKASIGGGRKLQESCPDGSGLMVTHTLSAGGTLAHCYVELELTDVSNSYPEYYSGFGFIYAVASEADPTTEYWALQYWSGSSPMCQSVEPASSVHPSEASWECEDGTTTGDLSVDCGCGDAPGENGSCSLDASADVTSSLFPESDSCLVWEVFGVNSFGYRSSTLLIISSGETTDDDQETPLVDWWIWMAYVGDFSDETWQSGESFNTATLVAASVENALYVHPSETNWKSFYPGDYLDYHTGTDFVVNCGCDGVVSSSPTTTTSSTDIDDDAGDAQDAEEESPGTVGSTSGAVSRSLSAWSTGATGVAAAVMILAKGWW